MTDSGTKYNGEEWWKILKKITQAQSEISDDAHCSVYFEKHKTRPTCPFCGATMHFTSSYYYEGHDEYWGCPECGCLLSNNEDFSEEERKEARTRMRKELKEEIEKREKGIQYFKERLKLWGRYMSDEEKVRLLAERLEGEG